MLSQTARMESENIPHIPKRFKITICTVLFICINYFCPFDCIGQQGIFLPKKISEASRKKCICSNVN